MENIQNKLTVLEQDFDQRLLQDYPGLYRNKFVLVDNKQTRLAIDDVSCKTSTSLSDGIELLLMSCKGWVEVYDAGQLTQTLSLKMQSFLKALDRKKTLLVFPGNGAKIVEDLLLEEIDLEGFSRVSVDVQRKVSANGNVSRVEVLDKVPIREKIKEMKPNMIIVIDDVIMSGSTLMSLKEAFPIRGAEWFGASLMALSPTQNKKNGKPSGVEGYKSIITPIVYQGISGIPSLNSISTLIGNTEKSQQVRDTYCQKYVQDRDAFYQAIRSLQ